MIKLIKPTLEYVDQIWSYREIFINSDDDMGGCGCLRRVNSAKEWIEENKLYESKETCPEGKVCSDTYIAVRESDNKLVGVIDLRHEIESHPILREWGGHIGYSVHPSERRKGYAKEMLRLNLDNARKLGLKKVMISCNEDNIASAKTIMANGGVFEKAVEVEGRIIHRYWITL